MNIFNSIANILLHGSKATGIGFLIVIAVLILIKLFIDRDKDDISIKKLIREDTSFKRRIYMYYLLFIIVSLCDILSYIGLIRSIIILKSHILEIENIINSIIFLILVIIFYFTLIWMMNHSHMIKRDTFPIYKIKNKSFLILNSSNNQMLVIALSNSDLNKNNELIRINPNDDKYIKDIEILNYHKINFIKNGIN